jgi:hypothetical protein
MPGYGQDLGAGLVAIMMVIAIIALAVGHWIL